MYATMKEILLSEFYNLYMNHKKAIYLYGASLTGKGIEKLLSKNNIKITAFIDGNPKKRGSTFQGYKVISPEDMPRDSYVIITAGKSYIHEISNMLSEKYLIKDIFYFKAENRIVKTNVFMNGYDEKNAYYFEEIFQFIKLKHQRIKLFYMWSDRMGELIYRFEIYKKLEHCKKDNVYRVILPYIEESASQVANKRFMQIISREINFIYGKNEQLWSYIFLNHLFELDLTNCFAYDGYDMSCLPLYKKINERDIEFTEYEMIEASEKMKELGINKEFVCIFARDKAFLNNRDNKSLDAWSYHDYRDTDIKKFELLVNYLKASNLQIVRVGSISNEKIDSNDVIDITNENHDDLLDLYINSKCKRWIGGESGAFFIPQLFGRKITYVNVTNILNIYPTMMFCINDKSSLYIPKLYFSEKEKRYLNIREMCLMNLLEIWPHQYYEKYGVYMVENSPEDILDVYKESEAKDNGEWEYTEEENKLQDNYIRILNQVCYEHPRAPEFLMSFETKQCINPVKIGTTFLKKYPFLLN